MKKYSRKFLFVYIVIPEVFSLFWGPLSMRPGRMVILVVHAMVISILDVSILSPAKS